MSYRCCSALRDHPLPCGRCGAEYRHPIPVSRTRPLSHMLLHIYSFSVPLRVGGRVGLSTEYICNHWIPRPLSYESSAPVCITSPLHHHHHHHHRRRRRRRRCHRHDIIVHPLQKLRQVLHRNTVFSIANAALRKRVVILYFKNKTVTDCTKVLK